MQLKRYWPLATLLLVALLAATSLASREIFSHVHWMHYFMGMVLTQFAMLKIFRPVDFADAFSMYDLIAKKSRIYAFFYPLIELGLGLSYLAFFAPVATYLLTIFLLGIGLIGVIKALRKGLDVRCACMGTVLDVPLSTVTLTEDLVMGLMALFLLITH